MARAQLITFYSFKGGVGRTMAMANVACQLANKHGHNVIAVDWDLEAPGLHYYFDYTEEELRERKGLLDYLYDFRAAVNQGAAGKEPVLKDYLVDLKPAIKDKLKFGSVRLMHCGRTDDNYMKRVQAFDWNAFYQDDNGFEIIETLKHRLREAAHLTLVDARAGQADIGTTPTIQVPDAVVLLFTTNRQNLYGMAEIARRLHRNADRLAMGMDPPRLLLVPSRVFADGVPFEHWLVNDAEPVYDLLLKEDVVSLQDQRKGLRQWQLPVDTGFAFGEGLPVLDQPCRHDNLHGAYSALAEAVNDLFEDPPGFERQIKGAPATCLEFSEIEGFKAELIKAVVRGDHHRTAGLKLRLGRATLDTNNIQEAELWLLEARGHFINRQDKVREGHSLFYLGQLYAVRRDDSRALETLERSGALAKELNDCHGEAVTLYAIGNVKRAGGALAEAWDFYQRAFNLEEQAGEVHGQSVTQHAMADVRREQGQLDEAWQLYERALALDEQAGNIRGQGVTLHAMGDVRQQQARLDDAWRLYEHALFLLEQVGETCGQSVTLHAMYNVRKHQQRFDEADELYRRAEELEHQGGVKSFLTGSQ